MSVRLRRLIPLLRDAGPAAPDGELVAAVAATRDDAAFAELVRRHRPIRGAPQ